MNFYVMEWVVELYLFHWHSLNGYKDNLTVLKKNLYQIVH